MKLVSDKQINLNPFEDKEDVRRKLDFLLVTPWFRIHFWIRICALILLQVSDSDLVSPETLGLGQQ